jgi:hypothetical protein
MLRFAQHDIDEVRAIETQSLKGEEVRKLTARVKSVSFLRLSYGFSASGLCRLTGLPSMKFKIFVIASS